MSVPFRAEAESQPVCGWSTLCLPIAHRRALGLFHLLVVVNRAALKVGAHASVCVLLAVLLVMPPGVGLLDPVYGDSV